MSELGAKQVYPWKTVLWAGLLVGTLDISAATVHFLVNGGKEPINILIYVASGVFGNVAFETGAPMAWWGMFFHYSIAYIWTAFFFIVHARLGFASRSWVLIGVLYGIFVWLVMNRVVLPLANTPKSPFRWTNAIVNCLILIAMIGMPLSFIARKRES